MVFVSFSQLLPILWNSFSIGTAKIMYFLVFFLEQASCPLNSSTSSFMMK